MDIGKSKRRVAASLSAGKDSRNKKLNEAHETSTCGPSFAVGILQASTPISDESTPNFERCLKNNYCLRTYSRPKREVPSEVVARLSDCSVSLSNMNITSVRDLHRNTKKAGRFRNSFRTFSKSNPSPVKHGNEYNKDVPKDLLLFQSPKVQQRKSKSDRRPLRKRVQMATRKEKLRGNKKSKYGRLPVKITIPARVPVVKRTPNPENGDEGDEYDFVDSNLI